MCLADAKNGKSLQMSGAGILGMFNTILMWRTLIFDTDHMSAFFFFFKVTP